MLYLGIDQHARQITVSLRDEIGDVAQARQVSTEPQKINAFFQRLTRERLRKGETFVAVLEVCGFRTIATSRGDDNRDESRKTAIHRPRDGEATSSKTLRNRQLRLALPLRTNPEEIEFGLTDSFRNGPLDRRARAENRSPLSSRCAPPRSCPPTRNWSGPGWSGTDLEKARCSLAHFCCLGVRPAVGRSAMSRQEIAGDEAMRTSTGRLPDLTVIKCGRASTGPSVPVRGVLTCAVGRERMLREVRRK
jgi:hypothetical protein